MPSEEEILETKLWTLAKYLRELPHCVEVVQIGGKQYRIKEVIDMSAELHKKVMILLEADDGSQDSAVEAQHGEGDVRVSGPDRQPRAHSSSVGPTTSHSGGPEEC